MCLSAVQVGKVVHAMSLKRASCLSSKYAKFLYFVLLLTRASISKASVFCSREVFGIPKYRDCANALSAVPTDNVIQFFVEQQLRNPSPGADWSMFVDPRPVGSQQEIVQLPKFWSQGEIS